jgi:hypothetical protein
VKRGREEDGSGVVLVGKGVLVRYDGVFVTQAYFKITAFLLGYNLKSSCTLVVERGEFECVPDRIQVLLAPSRTQAKIL